MTRLNRRTFLKGVIAAGVAVALRPVTPPGGGPLPSPDWNKERFVTPHPATRFTIPRGMSGTYMIRAIIINGKSVEIRRNANVIAQATRQGKEGPLDSYVMAFLEEGDYVETTAYADASIARLGI